MQATSALYKSLRENEYGIVQTKVTIAGKDYIDGLFHQQGDIAEISTPCQLFQDSKPGVGGTVCRELDLDLRTTGSDIPRMAKICVFVRLVLADELTETILQASEWIPKGEFYIDTRWLDVAETILTIHAYDAMLKAEEPYLQDGDAGEWPRPMPDVVADIARRMGVTVDARTVINPAYMVEHPNDLTMREILGYVAAAHVGNWIITDAGELYLVPFYNRALDLDYLVNEDGEEIIVGGVRILV